MIVDRSKSSIHGLGESTPDFGDLDLLDGEDLVVRMFVDVSLVEIYVNNRFTLTSRIYPSLETSICASYNFGSYPESAVDLRFLDRLRVAWPDRIPGDTLNEMGAHEGNELREQELGRSEGFLCPDIVA
jgi:beta-fructofuranosidase